MAVALVEETGEMLPDKGKVEEARFAYRDRNEPWRCDCCGNDETGERMESPHGAAQIALAPEENCGDRKRNRDADRTLGERRQSHSDIEQPVPASAPAP